MFKIKLIYKLFNWSIKFIFDQLTKTMNYWQFANLNIEAFSNTDVIYVFIIIEQPS